MRSLEPGSLGRSLPSLCLLVLAVSACVGGRFTKTDPPAVVLDPLAQAVFARISEARKAAGRSVPTVVPELRDVARRGAAEVARGEWTLKTAAFQSGLRSVSQTGRHVYSFATACVDPAQFGSPSVATSLEPLLMGVAAAPMQGGAVVVLVIAEPGVGALRADRMGGGAGGTLPSLDKYVHPATSSRPCGAEWPATQRAMF